ncbi:hypothetical protein [Tsukamurella soli]
MSNQPLPFSNGLPLRRMGAILVLVMAVLVWRFVAVDNTTFRILCGLAILFEIAFFGVLVLMSRRIRRQYAAVEAEIGAATSATDGPREPGTGEQSGTVEPGPTDHSE